MKTKIMNVLGGLGLCILLAGCSSQKPEVISTSVVTSEVIQPGSNSDFRQNVGDSVYFEYDRSHLSDEAKSTLSAQAKWLNQYPQYTVEVVGHCDERGTTEYNAALGQNRAHMAKKFLVSQGVSANRIEATSVGKSQPLCVGNTEESFAKNRAAVSLLLKNGTPIEVPSDVEQPIAVINNGQAIPAV
jgi:peptidoglycan-associated lipoprotein